MKKIILLFVSLLFIGCSIWKPMIGEDKEKKGSQNDEILTCIESDSMRNIFIAQQKKIDSLYNHLDNKNFTIDSLYEELEILKNQVKINLDFQIPDSIIFAGRTFDLTNERIYNKFSKIFNSEVQSAHRFIPRSGKYFAIFDSILAEYDVPLDAKYLAIAESRLTPMATSRVGAAGIWQFMKSTAKGYGMKVNNFIDERRNIFKSTRKAAQFLKNNYFYLQRFGAKDWLLAMSAYNAGPGNIAKIIKQQDSRDFFNLIMKADETHKYIWRAVATKMIFEYEEEIFGKVLKREKPLLEQVRLEKVKLKGYHDLNDWAKAQGTSLARIWEYNAWIKIHRRKRRVYSALNDVVLPPGEYTILVPKKAMKDENLVKIVERNFLNKNSGFYTSHTVKRGENLWKIAKKYNTSVAKIKRLNGLKSNIIHPGQKLNLTGSKKRVYVVKKGDSVGAIAHKLGVSTKYLLSKNNLKNKNGFVLIYPGQKLYY